jgi:hypothetical protein
MEISPKYVRRWSRPQIFFSHQRDVIPERDVKVNYFFSVALSKAKITGQAAGGSGGTADVCTPFHQGLQPYFAGHGHLEVATHFGKEPPPAGPCRETNKLGKI